MNLKTGDIIIVFGTGWTSKLIGFLTFGRASHAALFVDGKIYETDGSWMKSKYSPADKYDKKKVRVFRVRSFTDDHKKNLIQVCNHRQGTLYSYWDCFTQALFFPFNPKWTEPVLNKMTTAFMTKCDEETQICHNLARRLAGEKQDYFRNAGGKNPQLLMEELTASADADLVYETA